MANLEKRIALLEGARAVANLKSMTDDELMAYAGTFEPGSSEMYAAVLTLVGRHPSAFPIVQDDPDHSPCNERA